MNLRLLFFASCRERVGATTGTLDLPAGATVADAVARIGETWPALSRLLPAVRVAVNREFASPSQPLAEGDELALIPPVSGGAGRAALSHEPVAPDAANALIDGDRSGAIVTFTGVVRPTSKSGRAVTRLEYEAYEPMALAKLEQCLAEARERWPVQDAAVVHRLGALGLGDVAVSIAVAAGHRGEAFAACAYVIDRVKQIVPIWKKETGPDGSEWVSEGA